MASFQKQLLDYADRLHIQECNAILIEKVVAELGLSEKDSYLWFGSEEWVNDGPLSGPYIRLYPRDVVDDLSATLADAAKVLLPKVGRFEKSFDGNSNQLRLTGNYKGVRVVLVDTPPDTCNVEVIEEEQFIPAYHGTRKRYVLKGDCDPLLEKATAG